MTGSSAHSPCHSNAGTENKGQAYEKEEEGKGKSNKGSCTVLPVLWEEVQRTDHPYRLLKAKNQSGLRISELVRGSACPARGLQPLASPGGGCCCVSGQRKARRKEKWEKKKKIKKKIKE